MSGEKRGGGGAERPREGGSVGPIKGEGKGKEALDLRHYRVDMTGPQALRALAALIEEWDRQPDGYIPDLDVTKRSHIIAMIAIDQASHTARETFLLLERVYEMTPDTITELNEPNANRSEGPNG